MQLEYRILGATTWKTLEEMVKEALANGWQFAGPLVVDKDNRHFYKEMVKEKQSQLEKTQVEATLDARFNEKYSALDPKIKDLLEINGIELMSQNGKLFTIIGGKVSEGILPSKVAHALITSKHCPLSLSVEEITAKLETLV